MAERGIGKVEELVQKTLSLNVEESEECVPSSAEAVEVIELSGG